METVNFECGHCHKLMAVTSNLLGRQVRCPHCQQVVVAPLPQAPTAPVPSPPMVFEPPGFQEQESIFTPPEEQSDDLFGGINLPQPELPPEPTWQAPSQPVPMQLDLTAAPQPEPTMSYTPSPEGPTAFYPPPGSGSSTEPSNPWMTLPEDGSPTAPEPESTFDSSPPPSFTTGPRQTKKAPSWLLPVLILPLITYSIVVTALLVICFMELEKVRSVDPLQGLGDDGFNPPASKAGKNGLRTPIAYGEKTVNGDLPPNLKTKLGQAIRINQLEVKPLAVKVANVTIKRGNYSPDQLSTPSLVLFLELTNLSSDVEFCPLDPWYDRHYSFKKNPQKRHMPFTQLEIDEQRFHGGPAENEGDTREVLMIDKFDEDLQPSPDKRFRQNADRKLLPGQKMLTFVATNTDVDVPKLARASKGPMLYRVRLRTGLADIRGKEMSVTSVVGVEFTKQEITALE